MIENINMNFNVIQMSSIRKSNQLSSGGWQFYGKKKYFLVYVNNRFKFKFN